MSRMSTPSMLTLPALGLVQTRDQVGQRGLARAGLPDERRARSGGYLRRRSHCSVQGACSGS